MQHAPEPHPEPVLSNDPQAHGYPYSQTRPPPPLKSHSHSSSSHQSRSSSARPDLEPIAGNSHVDSHGGPYPGHSRSPIVPDPQGHQLPHQHIHVPQQNRPTSPPLVSPTGHGRDGRIHNHQRIGPGAHIHRERNTERDRELQQQLQYERELEREREEQRAIELRHRLAMEEQEEEALWAQEEARVRARALSRSRSPGSVPRTGESRGTSRPASGQAQEHDRIQRPYAPHVSNLLGIERDPGFNDDDRGVGPSFRDRTLAAEIQVAD
ncbi:hypothetical protein NUW54_g13396 [Trametes sanguinea]|uniref:Uncharacterized protein n=1 Tax=Trametes sanguinea TaxID=158606 RepID=A0ACC1MNH3_9APHY|nr:hypothetical protein NUW54_g13396 [Trametes sanguinea]